MQKLILGSSSPFRAELLAKIGIEFSQASPDIDERIHDGETSEELVKRLAIEKAQVISSSYPDALIIGSDQVAVLEGRILGKPGNHQNAMEQLSQAAGKTVQFLTGLTLLNSSTGRIQTHVEPFEVTFKTLTQAQILFYLNTEKPYQCAGSFKSEGLGIALFESMVGNDPNSLIGLPLIRLVEMLKAEGVDVLQPH